MNIVNFNNTEVIFSLKNDLWLNATFIAEKFNKDLSNYWKSQDTKKYIEVLQKVNSVESTELKVTQRGRYGGTYIHPDLVVHFARWISPEFAIACDKYIKSQLVKTAKQQFEEECKLKLKQQQKVIAVNTSKVNRKLRHQELQDLVKHGILRAKKVPCTKWIYEVTDFGSKIGYYKDDNGIIKTIQGELNG
jgi:hypothetical protein